MWPIYIFQMIVSINAAKKTYEQDLCYKSKWFQFDTILFYIRQKFVLRVVLGSASI